MTQALLDRVLDKVDVAPAWEACWSWKASISPYGYGQIRVGSRTDQSSRMVGAHRVMYELAVGPIAPGLEIDHLCRRRSCVNPLHLESVPKRINVERGESFSARNARKTHCPAGHPYDGINPTNGGRMCTLCSRESDRRVRARRASRRLKVA